MEATGRDRSISSSSYSSSSSRSGTIVSTGSTSSASRPSIESVEEAMHFLSLRIHGDCEEAEEEEAEHRSTILVKRERGDMSVSSSLLKKRASSSSSDRSTKEAGLGRAMATSVVNGNGGSGREALIEVLQRISELVRQLEVNLRNTSSPSSVDLCRHLVWQICSLTDHSISLVHASEPSISLRRVRARYITLRCVRKRSAGADHLVDDGEMAGCSSYTTISSSARSGTIVSTAYTSSRSASAHSSSSISTTMESVFCFQLDNLDMEVREGKTTEETFKEMKMKHIGSLVQEFFGRPSANLNNEGGDMNVLERWFTELGVSWVLQLDVAASKLVLGHPRVRIWIQALARITETIHLMESFFPYHGQAFVGMSGISEEEEVDSGKQAATSLDPVQFARFFQKKMLIFVDVMFSKSISLHEPRNTSSVSLNYCLKVNRALSEVLLGIRFLFHSSPPVEVEKIQKEMVSLLSAKQDKAFDAIWSFMEERRTRALKSTEDSLGAQTLQGSSDIHQATCSVINHIKFLLNKCDPLFVSQAASLGYVPQTGLQDTQPLVSMIAEMLSSLEEKLITKSQSFLDKGLGLLFLLNNSNFIREQLQHSLYYVEVDLAAVITGIIRKVKHYTESYIQVSWEPMLTRLSNYRPLRLVGKYSPLSKFKSEFQETYTTQKLWKVPDPGLRTRLHKAVIEKVIPAYTKHIEDNKVTNPKFTPQELEEMLQELFEG